MTLTIKNKYGKIKITDTWIHNFKVKKRYRNKGHGTELLKIAMEIGGDKLFVKKDNYKAIHLYKKLGFEYFSDDERKGYIDMKLRGEIR